MYNSIKAIFALGLLALLSTTIGFCMMPCDNFDIDGYKKDWVLRRLDANGQTAVIEEENWITNDDKEISDDLIDYLKNKKTNSPFFEDEKYSSLVKKQIIIKSLDGATIRKIEFPKGTWLKGHKVITGCKEIPLTLEVNAEKPTQPILNVWSTEKVSEKFNDHQLTFEDAYQYTGDKFNVMIWAAISNAFNFIALQLLNPASNPPFTTILYGKNKNSEKKEDYTIISRIPRKSGFESKFSSDENILFDAYDYKSVTLYDTETGSKLYTLDLSEFRGVHSYKQLLYTKESLYDIEGNFVAKLINNDEEWIKAVGSVQCVLENERNKLAVLKNFVQNENAQLVIPEVIDMWDSRFFEEGKKLVVMPRGGKNPQNNDLLIYNVEEETKENFDEVKKEVKEENSNNNKGWLNLCVIQ